LELLVLQVQQDRLAQLEPEAQSVRLVLKALKEHTGQLVPLAQLA